MKRQSVHSTSKDNVILKQQMFKVDGTCLHFQGIWLWSMQRAVERCARLWAKCSGPLERDRPSEASYKNTQRYVCCVSSDQQLPPRLVQYAHVWQLQNPQRPVCLPLRLQYLASCALPCFISWHVDWKCLISCPNFVLLFSQLTAETVMLHIYILSLWSFIYCIHEYIKWKSLFGGRPAT